MLEVSEIDLELVAGSVRVKGAGNVAVSMAQIAKRMSGTLTVLTPFDMDPGLEATFVLQHQTTGLCRRDKHRGG